MNFGFKKTTCRVLVVSVLALSFQTAQAGLIGADQAAAPASGERAMCEARSTARTWSRICSGWRRPAVRRASDVRS